MTFADLVTADMNFRHQERVREGKPYKPEDMPDWDRSICNVLEKYRLIAPGVSGLPPEPVAAGRPSKYRRIEPEELEVVSLPELGLPR